MISVRVPTTGFEPATYRLTSGCSTVELRRVDAMRERICSTTSTCGRTPRLRSCRWRVLRRLPRTAERPYAKGDSNPHRHLFERCASADWATGAGGTSRKRGRLVPVRGAGGSRTRIRRLAITRLLSTGTQADQDTGGSMTVPCVHPVRLERTTRALRVRCSTS